MEDLKVKLLDFFGDLDFNKEKHVYTLKSNGKYLPSVSKKIKKFYPPFNADEIAKKKGEREGIDPEQLKKEWKEKADKACDNGHTVHDFGELYAFDRSLKPSSKQEEAVVKFWNDLPDHIVPVVMELRMYHKKFLFAGTADILLYDMIEGCFIICDYKTNEDLFKNFAGQKLLGPFRKLLDNPYNKYQIQLNYYELMLEQFGIKSCSKRIIWLLPDGDYKMYKMNDFKEILKVKENY